MSIVPGSLALGFSRQQSGKSGDVATGGSGNFSAFNNGLTTVQIVLIAGAALVGVLLFRKRK